MDTKVWRLCSLLCLVCLAVARPAPSEGDGHQPSGGESKKSVDDILQDMKMASSEPEEDHGEDKGFFSKGVKGGMDKGMKKYNMDDYHKKGNDYGKKAKKEYDAKDKYGSNKYDKKDMNNFGEKWGDKSGKEKKGKFEEWKQDQKWKTDKGKGYEKKYEYDKSEGHKMSAGKKSKDEKKKHEEKHGEKHGFNKKAMSGKDNYGKKANNGKSSHMDWGKMYKAGGKHNKGMNMHEKKHPSSHKSSKWEKKKKGKKPPPKPKHDGYESEAEGEDDQGYEEGGQEMGGQEMGGHDMGGHDMGEEGAYDLGDGQELAGEYGGEHELLDGQGAFVPQEVGYTELANQPYVLDEAAAGQLAAQMADWY